MSDMLGCLPTEEDELSLPVAPVNKLIKEAVPNHRVSLNRNFSKSQSERDVVLERTLLIKNFFTLMVL